MADNDVTNPLGLPLTDEHQSWADAMSHVPDRAEIGSLLVKYYQQPITEQVIDRIELIFKETRSSSGLAAYHAHFASPTRWRGKAWNEDFSQDRRSMTPSDLLLMLANMLASHDPAFPQPKLYCPAEFVGTWEQIVPEPTINAPCLWHMEEDGTFQTHSRDTSPNPNYWCVVRSYSSFGDELVLLESRDGGPWGIGGIVPTATELTGVHLGYVNKIPFRLRRVTSIIRSSQCRDDSP